MIRHLPISAALASLLGGCGAPDASTLTHPPRSASFPMYVTVPGTTLGTGAIYQIDAPASVDGLSSPTLFLSNLNFPSAVSVSKDGTVFFAERPTPSTGSISKVGATGVVVPIVTNLNDPQGIAVDSIDRLYAVEAGNGTVSQIAIDGTRTEIFSGLARPRALAVDAVDNLLVTEANAGTAVRIIPDGTRIDASQGLTYPIAFTPGLVGGLYCLDAGTGDGDGTVFSVEDDGSRTAYLSRLLNPKGMAWEDGTIVYIVEGAPEFRILKYSRVTKATTLVARLPAEPHSVAFTPID